MATLKASTSAGNVALVGGVVALNATGGQQANFSSTPLAVAVDPVSSTLFVSTPANIQQYSRRPCCVSCYVACVACGTLRVSLFSLTSYHQV